MKDTVGSQIFKDAWPTVGTYTGGKTTVDEYSPGWVRALAARQAEADAAKAAKAAMNDDETGECED